MRRQEQRHDGITLQNQLTMCPQPNASELPWPGSPEPLTDDSAADGGSRPADALVPFVYDELRRLARRHLRSERQGHTLRTTALVHEAYLRLAEQHSLAGDERTRFFAAASSTMRRVLVDHARRHNRLKRGGGQEPLALDYVAEPLLSDEDCDELVALDEALDRLAKANPRAATVVQNRFFGGLSLDETADLLGISSKTVQRDWIAARAWLRKEVAHSLDSL